MNNEKELVVFSDLKSKELNITQIVKQGEEVISLLQTMGIKEATFISGTFLVPKL